MSESLIEAQAEEIRRLQQRRDLFADLEHRLGEQDDQSARELAEEILSECKRFGIIARLDRRRWK